MGDAVAEWLVPFAAAGTYMALALHAATGRIVEAGGDARGRLVFVLILFLAGVAAVCIALLVRAL